MFWNVWQSLGKLSEWLYSSLDTTIGIMSCIAWTARGLSEHVMSTPWLHYWTWHIKCPNPIWYTYMKKSEKLFILNKSREGKACIMYQPGDQGPVWAGAGRCCLSSSRLSWFSENFSPPVPGHWPSPVMCCVCTSQAHYNADDTAAQWSFVSSLLPPLNIEYTNNVCSLHTFAFHRLYQIVKLRVNVKRET